MDDYDSAHECYSAREMLRKMPVDERKETVGEFEDHVPDAFWAEHCNEYGLFRVVGNGEVTNLNCTVFTGRWRSCLTPEKHGVTLDGNFTGLTYLKRVRFTCHRADCPVCYETWCIRRAEAIKGRVDFGAKGGFDRNSKHHAPLGKAEHIVMSPPRELWEASPDVLFHKCKLACKRRGINSGNMIWHGFRYNDVDHWYWSVHFHIVGFITDGYSCRTCDAKHYRGNDLICEKKVCDGFTRRSRNVHKRDKWVCKVLGERKSIFQTALYQLSHCVVKVGSPRFQPSRWFGALGCRNLALPKVVRDRSKCKWCGGELGQVYYHGSERFVHEEWRDGYVKEPVVKLEEGGEPVLEDVSPFRFHVRRGGDSDE